MLESTCLRIPVLVVDQDPVFRQALAENLRFDGHTVIECPSAELAIPVIREGNCAALVTEYVVPGSDGVRLADEFRAVRAGPTVVVTAQTVGLVETVVEARRYVRLLPKPVGYEVLHDALHSLVEALSGS